MRTLIGAALLLLFLAVTVYGQAQETLTIELLQHKLRQKESLCTESCVRKYKLVEKCMDVCGTIITDSANVEQELDALLALPAQQEQALSEQTPEEIQDQATQNLFELYHKALREVLTSGSYSAGFQILDPAIELTDVDGQIPGWDSMPDQVLNRQYVDDFDNPAVLGQELILSSEVGPVRETNGIKWTDEYKSYLSGVQGVQGLAIPQASEIESAQKTIAYQYALNNCTEKYLFASSFIQSRYEIDTYTNFFCPEVKRAENEMFTQIGREQYMAGNNPVYAAAVALGVAQSMYAPHNAFKKFTSFRTMEAECLRAQAEGRAIVGNQRSLSFNYNYNTWKSTSETLTWKTTKRKLFFKKTTTHTKTTITNFDSTKVGGVEIAFADYRSVPIFPGEWFTKSAMRDFRYSPREPTASPINKFFGEHGTLTLMPKQLYVGLNPTISFWVSSDQKDFFKQTYNAVTKGGFGVFGIGITSKGNHQMRVEEGATYNGQTKVTMISTSCKPQLVAIDNQYTY